MRRIKLMILISTYGVGGFETRLERAKAPRGAKTELIEAAVRHFKNEFTVTDMERACPGVSRDMIRRVLRNLKTAGEIECLGRGPGAR